MFTDIQVKILKKISSPGAAGSRSRRPSESRLPLRVLTGNGFFERIAGKVVIDFGCGEGADAVEMAQAGATRVIGIDIRHDHLQIAREKARAAGISNISFANSTTELADIMISVDAFEHFGDHAEFCG